MTQPPPNKPRGRRAPIFIVGPSRSGTNLLRAILNRSSSVWISHETHYFDDLRPRLADPTTPLTDKQRDRCEDYFLALSHRAYGLSGDPNKSHIDRAELRSRAQAFGGSADALYSAFLDLETSQHHRDRCGDKTPRHVFRIDDIFKWCPNAHVLCAIRDPRATVCSYRDWPFAPYQGPLGTELKHAIQADQLRAQRSYNVLLSALLWKSATTASHRAQARHGDQRVRLTYYEDLINQPQIEVRELCRWLQIDYSDQMLLVRLIQSSHPTPDSDEAQLPRTEPLERWKHRLTTSEIAIIQHTCHQQMQQLGYPLQPVSSLAALTRAWLSLPTALCQALIANRHRLGNALQFLKTRAALAFGRA
jgi:hypothetical protein